MSLALRTLRPTTPAPDPKYLEQKARGKRIKRGLRTLFSPFLDTTNADESQRAWGADFSIRVGYGDYLEVHAKVDEVAAESGLAFLVIREQGARCLQPWAVSTRRRLLIYTVVDVRAKTVTLYFFNTLPLHAWAHCQTATATNHQGYVVEGLLVPLAELAKAAVFTCGAEELRSLQDDVCAYKDVLRLILGLED